jgi:hypothetical protein
MSTYARTKCHTTFRNLPLYRISGPCFQFFSLPPCWHWRLITQNIVHLEKLIFAHLITEYLAYYEICKFIIMFTRAHHWTLSWARWICSYMQPCINLPCASFVLNILCTSYSHYSSCLRTVAAVCSQLANTSIGRSAWKFCMVFILKLFGFAGASCAGNLVHM